VTAPAPAFGLKITRGDEGGGADSVHIAVEGELDMASASSLLEAIHDVLSAGAVGALTLDLAALRFIDSTGLRSVIEIEHEAARREVPLTVVHAPGEVTRLLQISGAAERLRLVAENQTSPAELDFLERTDLELTADLHAPSRAREAMRELLGQALDEMSLASVVLMTSELVTNAVLHPSVSSPSVVGLRVVIFPAHVHVEVDDPGQGFDPRARPPKQIQMPGPDQGGRGLFVVDRSAARWGIGQLENDRGRRFAVWFEVERP
jgi:anti-sigma B factor antagonist